MAVLEEDFAGSPVQAVPASVKSHPCPAAAVTPSAGDDRTETSVVPAPQIGIAELVCVRSLRQIRAGDHGIVTVFYIFATSGLSDGQALRLQPPAPARRILRAVRAACIHQQVTAVIHRHSGPGEASRPVVILIRGKRCRQILPGDHIFADRMSPVHRPPVGVIGMVLVEQVVLTVIEGESVRVI